jgi:hypothetical protein
MCVGVVLAVSICICIQVYKNCWGKVVNLPKKEIYSQDVEKGDVFIEVIIRSEEAYRTYAETYNISFEVGKVDFSQNGILLTSKYEVKALSYNEKNRKVSINSNNILDITYYKEETGKVYIYEIPHIYQLITWGETRAYKAPVFEE